MSNNKKVLKDMEEHLEAIASSIYDVAEKCPWVTGYEEEAVNMSTSLKTIADLCEENNDEQDCSLQTSLSSIARSLEEAPGNVDPKDVSDISIALQSISSSLASLVALKRQKNGLNYSPSPKHSKYLKRSMTKTADGRKKLGKVAFSRTGKRLFIRNQHDYTSE